ncbi:MAG: glycosyltransferase [Ignavibacteriaceae bacterium]|nr:glycosyltransferase [Ignavibacteriaceae bacterium]MCU0364192.1 glycosyltransferase [Ignavibacteriaceae bacterium]MCU0406529.1 glycosyltransferase [Ignavibacteriaceae bacterium]
MNNYFSGSLHHNKKKVCSVCIATFKRPELLRKLIQSLFDQKAIEDIKLEIVVVDNDVEISAKKVVAEFRDTPFINISYYSQPIQNISLTRNLALDKSSGQYFAVIDDDETADQYWIRNLIDTLEKFNADAVFGYVVPIFNPDIAQWKRQREIYFLPVGKTGDRPLFHYTTNCLVKADKVKKFNLRFDPKYGLTGGEDSVFFDLLSKYEATYVVCREAISYEIVPRYRTDLKFICKRYFQKGNNEGRIINDAIENKFQKMQKLIKSLIGIGYYGLQFFILLPIRTKWVLGLIRLCYFFGQFLAIFKLKSITDKTEYDTFGNN